LQEFQQLVGSIGKSCVIGHKIICIVLRVPARRIRHRWEATGALHARPYDEGAGPASPLPCSLTSCPFVLSDQVGSTTVTANADGTWNSEIRYSAFGEIRYSNGITQTNYRYTGQLAQAELGLDYYVARWYDPITAHFAQADTEAPKLGQSQTFDRYMYANDNPIRYNDPTGHDVGRGGNENMRDENYPTPYSYPYTYFNPYTYPAQYLGKPIGTPKVQPVPTPQVTPIPSGRSNSINGNSSGRSGVNFGSKKFNLSTPDIYMGMFILKIKNTYCAKQVDPDGKVTVTPDAPPEGTPSWISVNFDESSFEMDSPTTDESNFCKTIGVSISNWQIDPTLKLREQIQMKLPGNLEVDATQELDVSLNTIAAGAAIITTSAILLPEITIPTGYFVEKVLENSGG
jgi:RHS repeat-associated protein